MQHTIKTADEKVSINGVKLNNGESYPLFKLLTRLGIATATNEERDAGSKGKPSKVYSCPDSVTLTFSE